jgi:hypothetical protein
MELFSRGFLDTPKLEDITINSNPLYYNSAQKNDINVVIQGFKVFVSLISQSLIKVLFKYR